MHSLQAMLPMMFLSGILLSAESPGANNALPPGAQGLPGRPGSPDAKGPPPKKPASTTPADMAHVVYGSDKKFNVFDLWKARSDKPTPLVVFIHGGGFGGGNKEQVLTQFPLDEILKAGVSCASIDYRRLQSNPGPRQIIYPTLFLDCARAVQFLRHNAKEWNLDPTRFACSGGSAGAGMSLWIGFHKDLADPRSDDIHQIGFGLRLKKRWAP